MLILIILNNCVILTSKRATEADPKYSDKWEWTVIVDLILTNIGQNGYQSPELFLSDFP